MISRIQRKHRRPNTGSFAQLAPHRLRYCTSRRLRQLTPDRLPISRRAKQPM